MDQYARTFNENAALYDEVRPGYPAQLYSDIQAFAGMSDTAKILEIGAGSGIATAGMASRWNAEITALEPGVQLLNLARHRCRMYAHVRFIQSTFEEYATDDRFELIVAATAYHWIDLAVKLLKPATLLTPNGVLAVFWANYLPGSADIFNEISAAYTCVHPSLTGIGDGHRAMREKIQSRIDELKQTQGLEYAQHYEYTFTYPLTTEGYVGLLKTFSDNAVCAPDAIEPFYQEIRRIVARHGHTIMQPVLVNLELLRKSAP